MTVDEMTNKKRHCMVVHAYYPLGETRVEREALALIERGYEVDVLCLRDQGEPAQDVADGVNIYRLSVKRHRGKGTALQTLEYLAFFILVMAKLFVLHRRHHYGVIQVHNLPDFLVFSALWSKLTGARVVLDLHDLMPDFYAARFDKPLDSWPVRLVIWQERLSCAFANEVITVTETWRQTLIARGIPAQKITVVMNVAHDKLFSPTPDVPGAASVNGSNGHFNVIYHGTLTQRYGVDLIVKAIDQVRSDIDGVHLSILGGGDFREELLELVEQLDLDEHVDFSQGFLPTAELPDLIRQADAGVVPNRSDVFTGALLPTKLLEYIALGVPVIAARTPGIDSYFDDSMIEFFAPEDVTGLAESLRALYHDKNRRLELVQNASEFNQRYSWSKVSSDYTQLVERLNNN